CTTSIIRKTGGHGVPPLQLNRSAIKTYLPSIDLSVIKSLQWLNAFIAIQFTTSFVCKQILMKAS
ncbi:MAG TPA: hypothetical protein VJT69_17015, partial [Pyrinomonadaceae bacterium]|nr:hypothetical protein [Pyrinomonadaceae bacterium]